MRNLILAGFTLFISVGIAFSQAAVEGALTHGMAGTTASAAGKALGQVGNQLAGRLGQQTSTAIRPSVTVVRPGLQKVGKASQAKIAATNGNASGSIIASIQGGEPQPAKSNCAANQNSKDQKSAACANSKPVADPGHPAEITLPTPQ